MSDARRHALPIMVLLLLNALSVFAQRDRDSWIGGSPVEISGQIRLTDGTPLPKDVNVSLERFSGGIVDQIRADSLGKFRFANLQRGYYNVIVTAPGFTTSRQQVDLQVIQKAYLVVELLPEKSFAGTHPSGPGRVIDARVPIGAQKEFLAGEMAWKEKNIKGALPHLEEAVRLDPDFYDAELLLGTTYLELNQLEKAETTLHQALKLKPEAAAALFSLGELHRRQKHYAEAEKDLQAGLKLEDQSWQGHFTLARVYWEMNEIAKAAPQVGHTLQLRPDFAEAHLLAGNILLRVEQPERALLEYQEYLRLAPKGEFAAQTKELVQKLKQAAPAK